MTRIDAHQHYWEPRRGDYHWMPMDNAILARPYFPKDLHPHLEQHGFSHTVLVQAAATVNETEYMLGIADSTDSVAGVVGWIDFESPEDYAQLARLARHPKFCGVRPMIQDIADDDWMLREDVQWAYQALVDLDLSFDALGLSRHLANFHTILTRYPTMRVVVDHIMKPRIAQHPDDFAFWADGISRLAEDTGAFCKLSGMATEAAEGWQVDDLAPYAHHVLAAFGPERVMWGSDWPVCRLGANYEQWLAAAEAMTAHLTPDQRAQVFGGTAAAFYRLSV